MHERYLGLFTAIAASAMFACSDAAVEEMTAPPLAATPAPPLADNWPTIAELQEAEIPAALGIQILASSRFEDDYKTFFAEARVRFQWANEVGANLKASLVNRAGTTINQGSAGMGYRRLALPVAYGDTTFTLQLSTNGFTCGLIGKTSYDGFARQNVLNFQMLQVMLWEQTVSPTTAPDVMQPLCPPPPPPPPPAECEGPVYRLGPAHRGTDGVLTAWQSSCDAYPQPPSGDGATTVEICYVVWREFWTYDFMTHQYTMLFRYPLSVFCETVAI